jgi:predicted phosphodiesterase
MSERIMLLGDSHGNAKYIQAALNLASELGIPRVVQLGDFGVWPGEEGRVFLNAVNESSISTGVRFDFIDGNHEDFNQLDVYERESERAYDGSVLIRSNVHWWPRGSVTTIANKTVGFLGGAVSVDRNMRKENKSWWSQERLTISQVDSLIKNASGAVDVLLTHDAPRCVPMVGSGTWPSELIKDSDDMRGLLDQAILSLRPALVCHGHWHTLHYSTSNLRGWKFKTLGAGADSLVEGVCIVDFADLSIHRPDGYLFPESLSSLARKHKTASNHIEQKLLW